jgi:general secretion pathway protein B
MAWFWLAATPVAAPPMTPVPAPAVVRVEPPKVAPPPPATEVLPPAPEPVVPIVTKAPVPLPVPAAPPAQVAAVAPPASPAASSASDRLYSLAELPPDVAQALPKFSVSGGVYSTNVAQRMLVVNGQVFNEGSEIASGVVLEQIRPRVAVLKFRGLRISQPY